MTPSHSTPQHSHRTDPHPWSRDDVANAFDHFNHHPTDSQRDYARDHGIPRATLGDWLRQEDPAGCAPDLAAFLRSACGQRFLRRLVLAQFLIFNLQGACGLRLLADFLRQTGLDAFVASSYGALHTFGLEVEQHLAAFAAAERSRLAQDMPQRSIALVADENFHGAAPCLVALEPVANFILVEEYQPRRDAATWTDAITRGTADLPVEVVLLTGDEARGLIACAGQLDAHHLPELFHGLRDLASPLLGTLRCQIVSAGKQLQQATRGVERLRQEQEQAQREPVRPGRPVDYAGRIALAAAFERGAAQQVADCETRREQVRAAVRGLADDYHPFAAQTGAAQTAAAVEKRLEGRLAVLTTVAAAAELGGQAEAALTQGRSWLLVLVASVAWFWDLARHRVQALGLAAAAEAVVYEQLLPGLYWEQVARRGRTPADRQGQQELGARLVQQAWASAALLALPEHERAAVARVCREVVGLFQRSSSSVEGRNGRLALFQHGHTRLSAGKLAALTAVHNYVARREAGTTAAARFFGKGHRDALRWLLEEMPDLPRPAARRPRQGSQPALQAA